jgi:hypothetical protein
MPVKGKRVARRLLMCLAATLAPVGAMTSGAGESEGEPQNAPAHSPWMALPILSSDPKLGTSGGVLGGYLHTFDPQSRVSMFGAMVEYTSTHSMIAALFARTSSGADHHRVTAMLAYGLVKNEYDDYLGTGQPLRTSDDVRGFAGRYLYRFHGEWFVGAQAVIANYQVFGESAMDDQALDVLGIQGFKGSGIGAVVEHDSRDNEDMPTGGWFLNVNDIAYREWLGGDDSFDVYRVDFRAFWKHGDGHVFALRQNNHFTSDAPASAGATVLLRGYKQFQYLGQHMSSLEAEERFRIADRWGATLFAGAACLYGGGEAEFDSEDLYPSYGAGFHYVLKPEERMVANLEYAHGNEDNYGIYLNLGYAW